jgi:damage-control phosphatase, subfamily III
VHSADTVLELSRGFSEPFNAGDCVFPCEHLEKIREAFFELLTGVRLPDRAFLRLQGPSVCVRGTSDDSDALLNMTEFELQVASDNSPTEMSRSLPVGDGNRMWESLSKNHHNVGSRVDFVLNNAGLELFCDLALGM